MSQENDWNDKSRDELRETLRRYIRGQVRLMKNNQETILVACREIYLEDDCPETEREAFIQFAVSEIDETQAQLESEQILWPPETDCDRLDHVEAALREQGILLWQVSPCCDTCTRSELSDRIEVIDERHPGFRDSIRGYAFFIDQNMPDMLSDSTKLSVYLGYGWISPIESDVSEEVYKTNALSIAREVSARLREEGFEVDWDGDLARKLGVSINWLRREMLN